MHIAYNALNEPARQRKKNEDEQNKYKGYVAACNKYKHEIVAIQKYIPGWRPLFR